MPPLNPPLLMLAMLAMALPGLALADSPQALMAALDRLDNETPIRARLESELWRAEGKGEDREETTRTLTLSLTDNREGFSLQYGPKLLRRLDEEAEQQVTNPDAKTPLNDLAWRLNVNQLRPLLSPAQELRRAIKRAEFREAVSDEYDEQTVTRLIFDRDKSVVHERMRRYIKEFDSTLEIWVTPEGTPLASRVKLDAKGSILFVIRGEHQKM
ncbi:hypothetical protein [Marinimicrobium locisalis]|uniref:hypothetical protein n=1 Tax=Marinimicrobium locisalis TaxID=546022 RepID=UPI003221C18E